ncbi:hypothetical protein Poli38472_006281 [Pythium oligandrum]|uniref:Uncharacterized protein n=1 Tax=Pythium oligandrum TaxID=41045 RepID=A0A8K1CV39_PYTOL|nr:hypothetical protein Poli38472_006281 [Pythium oligandrum]|eukprot:TMW68813.1 hypothetical protein Poli38472_006281 [Pythium oligandrum]
MEELSFFNEREAECFEREDTLSQTDLEKLNVAEDMPEMERAEHLLKNGLEKQKLSVLSTLSKILASNNSKANLSLLLDCIKHIWQKCEAETSANSILPLEILKALAALTCATVEGKVLSNPAVSLHEEYSQQLEICQEEKKSAIFLLTEEQVAKQLVPLVLDFIGDTHQKDYAEIASLAVIACLHRLAGSVKKTQIIRVAMEKGDVSQPPGSRLICCMVLGAVTALSLLSPQDIEGLYFQKMMAMCQDTDAEVRKCMCIQLDALARAVGEVKACEELLPELLELLQDEEEQVKQAAFLTLLSLLDFFPQSERIKRIIPQLQSIVETLPDYLLPLLAEQYGSMVNKLAELNSLGNDTAPSFFQGYSKLSTREDAELRQLCAYNFPAIVKAFGNNFISMLMDDILVKLSSDCVEKVRQHIAAGLHEVALLLGPQRGIRYLKSVLVTLLKDESCIVHGTILSRMPALMSSAFAIINDEDQKGVILDAMLRSMVLYHSVLPASRNREQLVFVETLQQFPLWCSSDQIYEMVMPILFDLIEDGARPVQSLAIQTLVKCIRRNENSSHRFSLLSKLRGEYGHARSFWRRLLYLDACVYALDINSRQYCRLNFIDIAIELLEDAVPNVRLKAITLLPHWKIILTALSDDKMLDRIRIFLEECSVDSDRDVADAISEARQAIENNELSHHRRPQEEAEDKRRVSEEENLGLVSDHEDSSADSKWSSMLEYTLVVGKDGQVVRRARVKSLDLMNRLPGRPQGKDMSRGTGMGNSGLGGSSVGSGGLGSGVNSGMSSLAMAAKIDPSKSKLAPKTPTKPSSSAGTTLPNCGTSRPLNPSAMATKMPPTIKVMGSTGKLNTSGSKSAMGSSRSTAALSKESSTMTKIPIIRPSAPAKRESSPSTATKPSGSPSTALLSSSGPSTMMSGNPGPPAGSGLATAAMKNKLGSIESSGPSSSAPTAMRPRTMAPSSASKR